MIMRVLRSVFPLVLWLVALACGAIVVSGACVVLRASPLLLLIALGLWSAAWTWLCWLARRETRRVGPR